VLRCEISVREHGIHHIRIRGSKLDSLDRIVSICTEALGYHHTYPRRVDLPANRLSPPLAKETWSPSTLENCSDGILPTPLDLKVGPFRVAFFCPNTKNIDPQAPQTGNFVRNNRRTNNLFVSVDRPAQVHVRTSAPVSEHRLDIAKSSLPQWQRVQTYGDAIDLRMRSFVAMPVREHACLSRDRHFH